MRELEGGSVRECCVIVVHVESDASVVFRCLSGSFVLFRRLPLGCGPRVVLPRYQGSRLSLDVLTRLAVAEHEVGRLRLGWCEVRLGFYEFLALVLRKVRSVVLAVVIGASCLSGAISVKFSDCNSILQRGVLRFQPAFYSFLVDRHSKRTSI